MEVVVVHRTMLRVNEYLKKNSMKSRFFGQVHDAIESYVYKEEREEFWNKIKEEASRYYPEYNGIDLEIEGDLADYFGKGEYWHLGKEIS
jgi:DNA polymerase I-like protein with 3'-5' exonuclease and polymerase domains